MMCIPFFLSSHVEDFCHICSWLAGRLTFLVLFLVLTDCESHTLQLAYDANFQEYCVYESQEDVRLATAVNTASIFKTWKQNHILMFCTKHKRYAYSAIYYLLLSRRESNSSLSAFAVHYGKMGCNPNEYSEFVDLSFGKITKGPSKGQDLQMIEDCRLRVDDDEDSQDVTPSENMHLYSEGRNHDSGTKKKDGEDCSCEEYVSGGTFRSSSDGERFG